MYCFFPKNFLHPPFGCLTLLIPCIGLPLLQHWINLEICINEEWLEGVQMKGKQPWDSQYVRNLRISLSWTRNGDRPFYKRKGTDKWDEQVYHNHGSITKKLSDFFCHIWRTFCVIKMLVIACFVHSKMDSKRSSKQARIVQPVDKLMLSTSKLQI